MGKYRDRAYVKYFYIIFNLIWALLLLFLNLIICCYHFKIIKLVKSGNEETESSPISADQNCQHELQAVNQMVMIPVKLDDDEPVNRDEQNAASALSSKNGKANSEEGHFTVKQLYPRLQIG